MSSVGCIKSNNQPLFTIPPILSPSRKFQDSSRIEVVPKTALKARDRQILGWMEACSMQLLNATRMGITLIPK